MSSFFEQHPEWATPKPKEKEPDPPVVMPSLAGECTYCGVLNDDIMLGMCGDCV